jgi:hemolysin activation/secretion protein
VSFDNYGSRFTGPLLMQAGVSFGSLGSSLSSVSFNTAASTSLREMKRLGFSYDVPLWGVSGWTFSLTGDHAKTQPGDRLSILDIEGQSSSVSAQLSYPIMRQRDENWWVTGGFAYKNSKTDIGSDRLYEDRLRVLSFGTRYNFVDGASGLNSISVTYDQGLDILDNRKTGSQDLSRRDGQSDFSKFVATASRLQELPQNTQALVTFQGQYSGDPLLSSEEFGFGGGVLGRGYDPSEITGDRGFALSLELRKNYELKNTGQLQPYAYAEYGKVWNIDPSDENEISATAAGLGLRYFAPQEFTLDATVALPLSRPADNPPKYANPESPRFLLRLNKNF